MGAHSAQGGRDGRFAALAGRGLMSAAAVLALVGGGTGMAFAGESSEESSSSHDSDKDRDDKDRDKDDDDRDKDDDRDDKDDDDRDDDDKREVCTERSGGVVGDLPIVGEIIAPDECVEVDDTETVNGDGDVDDVTPAVDDTAGGSVTPTGTV